MDRHLDISLTFGMTADRAGQGQGVVGLLSDWLQAAVCVCVCVCVPVTVLQLQHRSAAVELTVGCVCPCVHQEAELEKAKGLLSRFKNDHMTHLLDLLDIPRSDLKDKVSILAQLTSYIYIYLYIFIPAAVHGKDAVCFAYTTCHQLAVPTPRLGVALSMQTLGAVNSELLPYQRSAVMHRCPTPQACHSNWP